MTDLHVRRLSLPRRALAVALALSPCACDEPASDAPIVGQVSGDDARPVTGACVPHDGADASPFAACVDAIEPAGDASFGHDALPGIVLGPPDGSDPTQGSFDVASLGCGGRITVMFDGPAVVDGPGPDFIVFENAFATGDETFAEPARVLVSDDGQRWFAFDCDTTAGWPAPGCAGVHPTTATDAAAARDPEHAGGDAFDLADLGLAEIRWVRLVDRTREYWDAETWCVGASAGFDLDAVARVEGS